MLPTALKSASKKAFLGPAYCQRKQENTYQLQRFSGKENCDTTSIKSMLTLQLPTSATFASTLCTNAKLDAGN